MQRREVQLVSFMFHLCKLGNTDLYMFISCQIIKLKEWTSLTFGGEAGVAERVKCGKRVFLSLLLFEAL